MPLLFTAFIALFLIAEGSYLDALFIALLPILIALAFVLAASVFIGIPATILLSKTCRESKSAYVGIGIFMGSLLPALVLIYMEAQEGWWVTFLGAFSGAMTGCTWWTSAREEKAAQ